MDDIDNIEEYKLLLLLDAVESVLGHEDAGAMLGTEMLDKFLECRKLLQGWLLHESGLTHDQRVSALALFTDALAQRKLAIERHAMQLH
jgi:hypothetical protein